MRIKFKKASILTKILFVIVLVYALITVGILQKNISQKEAHKQELISQLEILEQENERVSRRIGEMNTDKGIRSIAREKLGVLGKDEIVFYDLGR